MKMSASRVKGVLYVVATPIGNLADITFRAVQTLKDASIIAAEDTRHTKRLLAHYQIRNRLISLHEHNESRRAKELVERLLHGESIALVSNAGTQTLSDPGYRLITAVAAADIRIVPVPGASAALAALSASGLPTDAFLFLGFLPRKGGKRQEVLASLAHERKTVILYESPRRITTLIRELLEVWGDRQGVLARELTKRHEEFVRGSLSGILKALAERQELKGECTLLVKGCSDPGNPDAGALRDEIRQRLYGEGQRLSDLTKGVATRYGLPRKQVYREALKIKSNHDAAGRDDVDPD